MQSGQAGFGGATFSVMVREGSEWGSVRGKAAKERLGETPWRWNCVIVLWEVSQT